MKYKIIVGFFMAILAVPAMQSGNHGVCRVKYPQQWIEAVRRCWVNVSEDTKRSYFSLNKATATREAKRITLCYYTESGEFVNGRFDPVAIENFLRAHIGQHDSLEKLVKIYQTAANAANSEPGDNYDKAYAYHAILGIPDNVKVFKAIFRLPGNSK